ncbi:hypothetical protein EMIT036CA2_40217 [Chryseobacterium sp. IT-36CA2]
MRKNGFDFKISYTQMIITIQIVNDSYKNANDGKKQLMKKGVYE